MLRCLIALTSILTVAAAVAAPAWTWVDENGRRHFSDRPVPGAQRIELQASQTFSGTTTRPATGSGAQAPGAEQPATTYSAFEIVSPQHEETLWNIGGSLSVQLAISPALQAGHRIDMYLDGQLLELGARGTQLTIPEVYRGLHTLQAVVTNGRGQEIIRSLETTVMVQQTSLQNPNNRQATGAPGN